MTFAWQKPNAKGLNSSDGFVPNGSDCGSAPARASIGLFGLLGGKAVSFSFFLRLIFPSSDLWLSAQASCPRVMDSGVLYLRHSGGPVCDRGPRVILSTLHPSLGRRSP